MADAKPTTDKPTTDASTTAPATTAAGTTSGDVTYAKSDPRAHADLAPGESRLVASGAAVPDGPAAATAEQQAERRAAGIPEPPTPGPGTDMYLTQAGYVTVPAGVNPDEPVVVKDPRMDSRP